MRTPLSVAVVMGLLCAAFWVSLGVSPAGAMNSCALNGTMSTAANVYNAVTHGPTPGTFNTPPTNSVPPGTGLSLSGVGTCTEPGGLSFQGGSFSAASPIGNYCDHGTATMVFDGIAFDAAWTGNTWTLSAPSASGVLDVRPDATNGHSCMTGASGFIITGTILFDPPEVTTTSIDLPTTTSITMPTTTSITMPTTTSITMPTTTTTELPLGGPAGPSDSCGQIGTSTPNPVNLTLEADTSPNLAVCVRAGIYGGKLTIYPGVPGLPGVPPIPTTDTNADACHTTSGNTIGGPHPIVGPVTVNPGGHIVLFDVYAAGNQVWVCARASSSAQRLIITLPTVGPITTPAITFDPDPGTPDPL